MYSTVNFTASSQLRQMSAYECDCKLYKFSEVPYLSSRRDYLRHKS